VHDLAQGESVIKCPYPLNVLKDAYDQSCCLARSYEYDHLMTGSPGASTTPPEPCPTTSCSRMSSSELT
jgi:hypothetical protein